MRKILLRKISAYVLFFVAVILFAVARWKIGLGLLALVFILLPNEHKA
ncbi:MAG: hypothetical protein ACOC1S_00110 [bacterium]